MALSSEVYQEAEVATCLLSGASSLASKVSRMCLTILVSTRLLVLLGGRRTIWLNEEKDFSCNSSKLLCKPSCFDEFSPISSFNIFCLQMVSLLSHSLCVALLIRSGFQAREGWLHTQLRRKKIQVRLHAIILMSRMFIEGVFLFTFYKVTEGFVHNRTIQCQSTLCERFVICTDVSPAIKNIFNMYMCLASAASVIICLWELTGKLPFVQHVSNSSSGKPPSTKQSN